MRAARKLIVAITGGVLLVVGFALLFLPGPGALVILAGLAVLASEFEWAERRRARLKSAASRFFHRTRQTEEADRQP